MKQFGRARLRWIWWLVCLLLFCLVAACSPLQPTLSPEDAAVGRVIEGVPFYAQQGRYDCGPAALTSLLAQRGASVSLKEVRSVTYTPSLRGSLLPDLENFARSLDYKTCSGRGDLALLKDAIDADKPVLIPLEMGRWQLTRPHYVVVFGYVGNDFIVHTGQKARMTIAAGELDRRWKKLNRLYLYLE